jgi:hypothetical protein
MVADPEHLEETLLAEVEKVGRKHGETIIAFCLAK